MRWREGLGVEVGMGVGVRVGVVWWGWGLGLGKPCDVFDTTMVDAHWLGLGLGRPCDVFDTNMVGAHCALDEEDNLSYWSIGLLGLGLGLVVFVSYSDPQPQCRVPRKWYGVVGVEICRVKCCPGDFVVHA